MSTLLRRTGRAWLSTLALIVGLSPLICSTPALAQTSLNSTTLSAAVADTDNTVKVASASNIAVGDLLAVDREQMKITAISGTTLTVTRGLNGSQAVAHVTAALVYTGVPERFGSGSKSRPQGACTRTSIRFLPLILFPGGDVWDCPVGTAGTSVWTLLNDEGIRTAKTAWFNLDNGAGTTIDDVLIVPKRPIRIVACRAIEVDVTAGTVAAGNWKVGTTVGGADIVAATAYVNAAAVGSSTAGTILAGGIAIDGAVFVRHTGVAATAVGQAYVECDYIIR